MNSIKDLIEKENLVLEKDYGKGEYAYLVGKNIIIYPAFDDLNQPESVFSVAHELGHHSQQKEYNFISNLLSTLSRKKDLLSFIFFPFLLWEEVDAWIRAWRLCKKEGLTVDGFISCMAKSIFSYVVGFFHQIIRIFKYILALYISCVFWIRFLVISEDLKLQHPKWLQEIQHSVVNSTASESEIISEVFYTYLNVFLTLIIFFLICRILFNALSLLAGSNVNISITGKRKHKYNNINQ